MELNVAHSFSGLPWGYPHSRIKQRSESYDCSCILFVLSCSLISQHDILPLTTRLDWKQVFIKVTPVLNSIHQWHPTFTTCPNVTRKLNNHEEYWLPKMRGLENIIKKGTRGVNKKPLSFFICSDRKILSIKFDKQSARVAKLNLVEMPTYRKYLLCRSFAGWRMI